MRRLFYLMLVLLWGASLFCVADSSPEVMIACGMFGIITTKPKRFDYRGFCVLGIHNDVRGGDSCGIFVDGKTEYAADKNNKFFYNFFQQSKVLNRLNKTQVAIGHCRKASVGLITVAQAQPIVFADADGNTEFVVMHNGTIYNYKELAEKYIPGVNIVGLTDSQVLANIIYRCGYDVLGEYIGGASFVFVDYRKDAKHPAVMFFRGESKEYSYSTTTKEERPMWYACDDERIVFSSLGTYIAAIMPKEATFDTKTNCLLAWEGDSLVVKKTYDRRNKTQTIPYAVTTYTSQANNWWEDDVDYTQANQNTLAKNLHPGQVVLTVLGTYTKDNIPLHGKVNISMYGYTSQFESGYFYPFWFWNGVMLYDEKCFQFLEAFTKNYGCAIEELEQNFPEILYYLSPYPQIDFVVGQKSKKLYSEYKSPCEWRNFNGDVIFFMGKFKHFIKDGYLDYSVKASNLEAVAWLNERTKNANIDFNKILDWFAEENE